MPDTACALMNGVGGGAMAAARADVFVVGNGRQ